ncbi:hypothetical protein V5799_033585 [Amblyomma americanum]|uniref:Uncharacterized protein n=1 Tax=Amblyomma americanum TaxID=6943 RepID=A0AAQ4DMW0_AMBAM
MYAQSSLEQLYSDRDVILTMLAKQCRLTGGSLYVIPELVFTRFGAMAHAKGLPPVVEDRLHRKVTAIVESGLNLKWYDDGMREWYRCQAMQEELSSKGGELSFKVLRYEDMAAIFALWAIMAVFALVVFLLELCLSGKVTRRSYRLDRIEARRSTLLLGLQAPQSSSQPSRQ